MSFELLAEPVFVPARHLEITSDQPPVIDDDGGERYVVLHIQLHLGRCHGLLGRIGQNGKLTVCFQNGIFDGLEIADPLGPQFFRQFIHGKAVVFHGLLL